MRLRPWRCCDKPRWSDPGRYKLASWMIKRLFFSERPYYPNSAKERSEPVKCQRPLKTILAATRPHWDRATTRATARQAFAAALKCQTLELGGEKFASANYSMILPHTCKSRACLSCGYRACTQWLRERWAAFPRLAQALPALAATTIYAHASAKDGVRVGVIGILHTFNPKLEFNSHVQPWLPPAACLKAQACGCRRLTTFTAKYCNAGRRRSLSFSGRPWNPTNSKVTSRSSPLKIFLRNRKSVFGELRFSRSPPKNIFYDTRADMCD